MKKFPHCRDNPLYQKELKHIEMKIYLGDDMVDRDLLDFKQPGQPLHRAGDRPMSEVNWHCDYSTGATNNSMEKDSFALSLSLGNPRWVCYKRQWINENVTGKKGWSNVPATTDGNHKFFHRMEHGSLSILDPRDEDGRNNMRFQHMGKLSKNKDLDVDGKGVSVVLVCRSCPHTRTFHGMRADTPFYADVSEADMLKFNETADGKMKKFSGTGNSAGASPVFRAEKCHEIANDDNGGFAHFVKQRFHAFVRPNIINHVRKNPDWKTTKKKSGFQWKNTKDKTKYQTTEDKK
jgi:hypothetical protein